MLSFVVVAINQSFRTKKAIELPTSDLAELFVLRLDAFASLALPC